MHEHFWLAFGLTLFAGLATGIGSLFVFCTHRQNYRFLAWATSFAAGVMVYISFVEILPEGIEALEKHCGDGPTELWGVLAFFGGILGIMLIDRLVPKVDNPHEARSLDAIKEVQDDVLADQPTPAPGDHRSLHRMGILTALAIAIHNFPEGLATFLATLHDPHLGMAIAIGIALHNIPEGISVAVPIYYATGKRRPALILSLLSGLAEPAGAVIGYFLLRPFLNDAVLGALLAYVAGVMVFISFDELLPTSRAYGKGHDSMYGFIAGMAVMAASLLLLD